MDAVWQTFWAPLVVGVILWLIAEGVRWWWSQIARRRSRRRRIIALMGRAHAVAFRAIRDGKFDEAYALKSTAPIATERAQYDDLTAEALDLFEPGEEAVAMWAAVEFYAGWNAPFFQAFYDGVPRELPKSGRIFSTQDWTKRWQLVRPTELIDWATVRWPWDRGNARGPRYGHASGIGDTSRHEVVTPNSDNNEDMLRPWILLAGNNPWQDPSKRQMRQLRKRYPDWDLNLVTSSAARKKAMEEGRARQAQADARQQSSQGDG